VRSTCTATPVEIGFQKRSLLQADGLIRKTHRLHPADRLGRFEVVQHLTRCRQFLGRQPGQRPPVEGAAAELVGAGDQILAVVEHGAAVALGGFRDRLEVSERRLGF